METLKNYKFKDFIKLKDKNIIESYLPFLEALKPSNVIRNPNYKWWKKEPKKLQFKGIRELKFGDVISIRQSFSEGTEEGIIEAISILTGLEKKHIYNIRIIDFYSLVNSLKSQLIEIANIEMNELHNEDDSSIELEITRANERMARFGILNTINSLADNDITKFNQIQELSYNVVFSKLVMDKEIRKIEKEISEIQKKKNK